jgi:hypothetical protein
MDINQTIHLESHVVSTASASGKTNRWIVWYRPQSCWDAAVVHLPWALITGIPLLMSFLVPLHILPLIPCTLLRFTGYPCPFCGFTRSFWAMSAGDWTYALWNFPLSGLLYGLFAVGFIWNSVALLGGIRLKRGRAIRLNSLKNRYLIAFLSVLFLINWVYRLSLGLN